MPDEHTALCNLIWSDAARGPYCLDHSVKVSIERAKELREPFSARLEAAGHIEAAKEMRGYEEAREFFGMSVSELKHDVRASLAEGLDLDDVTPGKILEVAMVLLHAAKAKEHELLLLIRQELLDVTAGEGKESGLTPKTWNRLMEAKHAKVL